MSETAAAQHVAPPGLRQRLLRGAQGQSAGQIIRLVVQVGGVAILAGSWGLHLYGEWLILFAVPSYLAFSDIGLFAAAGNEMIMRVARGDRGGALIVFQAVSAAVTLLLGGVAFVLLAIVMFAPVNSWLNLHMISEFDTGWILMALGINTFLVAYAGILYGGFACDGRYGEGAFAVAGIALFEFVGLAGVVLLGGGPILAATAMLAARLPGTAAMYLAMRRRVPWLFFGRTPRIRSVLRPLVSPAAASGAIAGGLAINVQGLVILVGIALGPASVAIFSTLRTLSRLVIQLLAAVFAVIAPELSRAFAERDYEGVRKLHRGGCQAAVWLATPILVVLAVFGGFIVSVWTSGAVHAQPLLLYMFLAIAGLEALWTTSFAVMYATNRHQRLAVYYLLSSITSIPLAYVFLGAWGLNGGAASVVLLEIFMVCFTLRQALPATHDTLTAWLTSLSRPTLLRTALRRRAPEPATQPQT